MRDRDGLPHSWASGRQGYLLLKLQKSTCLSRSRCPEQAIRHGCQSRTWQKADPHIRATTNHGERWTVLNDFFTEDGVTQGNTSS